MITAVHENGISKGYLITCQQFIDDNFAEQVAKGDVEVFYYFEAPLETASDDEKAVYVFTTERHGNVESIATIEDVGDGYYFAHSKVNAAGGKGTLGLGARQMLLVWPK